MYGTKQSWPTLPTYCLITCTAVENFVWSRISPEICVYSYVKVHYHIIIKDFGYVWGREPFLWHILFVELQRGDTVYSLPFNVLCNKLCSCLTSLSPRQLFICCLISPWRLGTCTFMTNIKYNDENKTRPPKATCCWFRFDIQSVTLMKPQNFLEMRLYIQYMGDFAMLNKNKAVQLTLSGYIKVKKGLAQMLDYSQWSHSVVSGDAEERLERPRGQCLLRLRPFRLLSTQSCFDSGLHGLNPETLIEPNWFAETR